MAGSVKSNSGATDAMIFAAGLGTRLQPLTLKTPKALIEVKGKPLLLYAIETLYKAGIRHIVVNVHHHADQVEAYLNNIRIADLQISISDERDILRETGGGVLYALPLFKSDTIVLYNADILCDLSIATILACHKARNAKASLVTSLRSSSRNLLFDVSDRLVGWNHREKAHFKWCRSTMNQIQRKAFQGISIIQKDILTQTNLKGNFSLIDLYLELGKSGKVYSCSPDLYQWFDIGNPQKLKIAEGSWQSSE